MAVGQRTHIETTASFGYRVRRRRKALDLTQHAVALYQQALALARDAGHHYLSVMARSNFGRVMHAQSDDLQALAQIEEGVAWFRDVGHKAGLSSALHQLSAVTYAQSDDVRASALLREGLVLQQKRIRIVPLLVRLSPFVH